MPTPSNWDPSSYNQATTGGFTLGAVYEYLGREYRFILLSASSAALVATDLTEWASSTTYTVAKSKDAAALGRIPAGVAMGSITAGNYGFVLVRGIATVKSNSSTTGKPQVSDTGIAGTCNDTAAATSAPFGVALTGTSTGTCVVMVDV